jgi:hypothetical protein
MKRITGLDMGFRWVYTVRAYGKDEKRHWR